MQHLLMKSTSGRASALKKWLQKLTGDQHINLYMDNCHKYLHVSANLMDQHLTLEGSVICIDSKLQESNEYCDEVLSVIFEYISRILDEFMRAFKIQSPVILEQIQKDFIKVSQSLSKE